MDEAALLTVTDEPDTAVTVVPAAIPDDVDVTVAPTAIVDESKCVESEASTKTAESLTIATSVTTVCEMVYVGATVGEADGAAEGATDGLGVGFPGV